MYVGISWQIKPPASELKGTFKPLYNNILSHYLSASSDTNLDNVVSRAVAETRARLHGIARMTLDPAIYSFELSHICYSCIQLALWFQIEVDYLY